MAAAGLAIDLVADEERIGTVCQLTSHQGYSRVCQNGSGCAHRNEGYASAQQGSERGIARSPEAVGHVQVAHRRGEETGCGRDEGKKQLD